MLVVGGCLVLVTRCGVDAPGREVEPSSRRVFKHYGEIRGVTGLDLEFVEKRKILLMFKHAYGGGREREF